MGRQRAIAENTSEMYRKILNDPLKFPDEMGKDAQNLITRLLSRDPESRLGSNGAEEIKKHPFFKSGASSPFPFLHSPCLYIRPNQWANTPSPIPRSRLEETPCETDPATV